MRFANAAFKHGITEGQIRHVVEYWQPPFSIASASAPTREVLLFVGEDRRGVRLEVIAVEEEGPHGESELLVFHAMRLQPAYGHYYQEILRWKYGD